MATMRIDGVKAPQRLKTPRARLRHRHVLVQNRLYFVDAFENTSSGISVREDLELQARPVREHVVQGLLDVKFFCGGLGDLRRGGFACCRGLRALSRRRRDSSPSEFGRCATHARVANYFFEDAVHQALVEGVGMASQVV